MFEPLLTMTDRMMAGMVQMRTWMEAQKQMAATTVITMENTK